MEGGGGLWLGGTNCSALKEGHFDVLSDCHETLQIIIWELINEIVVLGVEPKDASLWWTSAGAEVDKDSGDRWWSVSFSKEFDLLGFRFRKNGKSDVSNARTLKNGTHCMRRDDLIFKSKNISSKHCHGERSPLQLAGHSSMLVVSTDQRHSTHWRCAGLFIRLRRSRCRLHCWVPEAVLSNPKLMSGPPQPRRRDDKTV